MALVFVVGTVAGSPDSDAARRLDDGGPTGALGNPAKYVDALGDAVAGGMDMTNVAVTADDGGTLRFVIETPGHDTVPPGHRIEVYFNTDLIRSTGSEGGSEYAISDQAGRPYLFRWVGNGWEQVSVSSTDLVAGSASGVHTIGVRSELLGSPRTFDFQLQTRNESHTLTDSAPDSLRRWRYPTAPAVGVIARAWMSRPASERPVTRLRRTTGLQANFLFSVRPVEGSRLRLRWFVNGKGRRPEAKDRTERVTSFILDGNGLGHGMYRAVLYVKPAGGRFTAVATARARVG